MKFKITIISLLTCLGMAFCIMLVANNGRTNTDETINNPTSTTTAYANVLAAPPIPSTLFFADERVPLDIYWVKEGLEKELIINCFQHSKTLTTIKRSARFFPEMTAILQEEGLPTDLLYLCVTESNLENVVSPAKAAGFWQFMPTTGKAYGLEIDSYVDERYHLEKATRAACAYLKKLKTEFGSWSLAAAAYNRGEGGIARALESQLTDNYWDLYLNQETQRYFYRILAYKLMFENKENYGIIFNDNDYYQPIPYIEDTISSSIDDLRVFAKKQGCTYRELKELNPWLRNTSLPVVHNKYVFRLPKESAKFAKE